MQNQIGGRPLLPSKLGVMPTKSPHTPRPPLHAREGEKRDLHLFSGGHTASSLHHSRLEAFSNQLSIFSFSE